MAQARRQSAKRNRLLTAAASAVCHLAVLLVLVRAEADPPPADAPAMVVQLIQLPPKPPAPPAPKPAPEPPALTPPRPKAAPVKTPSPPRRAVARPAPAPPDVTPLVADVGPATNPDAEVSDAELASASTADSGGGGGGGGACNMAKWLQGKLRTDRRVQAALAEAHRGRAIRVWNGDWVRHPGQDGNGLAAVREAIMWEVAFAPEACRAERVHGLVLLSLNDSPGSARLVMGSGSWRWSDLVSRSRR